MIRKIRKVVHRTRKHFMERDHGPYGWGLDESVSGNQKYKRWQSSTYGEKFYDYRTKREKQNDDDRMLDNKEKD